MALLARVKSKLNPRRIVSVSHPSQANATKALKIRHA